jgi:A/G-specific adenine glycosylase
MAEPMRTVSTAPMPLTRRRLNARLFRWHRQSGRTLPLRDTEEPWAILVGEVMSQQTQIDRIQGPWASFMRTWPTPEDLAAAATPDLLKAWAGLGYNRRALRLRDAARVVADRHAGQVPGDIAALEALPGLGPYTARAVAASAFGVPVAPLDVNVRRVVSRLLGTDEGLQERADALVARNAARRWLDAVMDLSATVCRPDPRCTECPLVALCPSAGRAQPRGNRVPGESFPATRRWLRGRLVAMATAAGGAWVDAPDALGLHDGPAVSASLADLAREGFLDVDGRRFRAAD